MLLMISGDKRNAVRCVEAQSASLSSPPLAYLYNELMNELEVALLQINCMVLL